MDFLLNNKLNNAVKLIIICGLIILTVLCFTCYHANLTGFICFIAFFVFYVQLPGMFFLRLTGFKSAHVSTSLAVGLFAGWAFQLIMYFVTDFINTNILLYIAGPALSALYIAVAIRDRDVLKISRLRFSGLSTALCIFLALALFYSLCNTQYIYLSPELSDFTYLGPDKGYHLGLINSAANGWPIEAPWIDGRTINYHLFTELLYSIPLRLFGTPADTLFLTCGPFMTVYVFAVSLYSFFKEFTARKNRAGLYCLAVMLSNIFICKGINRSLAFFFIFRNENATAYGLGCAMAAIVVFRYWYNNFTGGKGHLKPLILLTALIMLVTGIKGPIGLVIIGAIWGTYVVGLILRKVPVKTIIPIIILSIGFYLVYVIILGSKGQSNGIGNSIFAMATVVNITFYKSAVVAFLKGLGLPKIIRLGLLVCVFVAFTFTAFALPFVIGYIRELFLVITGRKNYDFAAVIIYAACLVGFVAMCIMNYSGHSQVYFGFVAVIFAPLVAFRFFEDMEKNKSFAMKLVRVIFILCLIATTCTLIPQYKYYANDAVDFAEDNISFERYLCISRDEYEAMVWLRDNTDRDALIATDRYFSCPKEEYSYSDRWANRFFLYADYSDRFFYIEGSGYNLPAAEWYIRQEMIEKNMKLYDAGNSNRGKLARKLGIDYIVVSKDFRNEPLDLSNKDYTLCYTNKDIDIYKVAD